MHDYMKFLLYSSANAHTLQSRFDVTLTVKTVLAIKKQDLNILSASLHNFDLSYDISEFENPSVETDKSAPNFPMYRLQYF